MGTVLDKRAEHAASIDDAWKILIPATIAATYSVIEKDSSTGLMSRLSLTEYERSDILRRLKSTFGAEVTKGMQAGQIPLVSAAASLYEVLGNQGRPTREGKEAEVNDIREFGDTLNRVIAAPTQPREVKPVSKPDVLVNAPSQTDSQKTISADLTKNYLSRVEATIKRLWVAPLVNHGGHTLAVIVKFRLERDGRVGSIRTEQSSGNTYYDLSAHRAIGAASPLPPFPPQVTDSYFDVSFTFAAGGGR